jgi:COPII coat assembly protein SEC16
LKITKIILSSQNEFQGATQNMFIPPQSTSIDQSYYYSYQMAQYYQQQAFYYQQYYEHLQQQQQQNQMPTPQLDEIELDAIKEDKNFNQIQKIIKNNEQTLLFNRCKTHVKGVFSMNKMIIIEANNPRNGEQALVEIHNLYDIVEDYLNEDVNYKILKEYAGPLKRVGTETTQLLKGTIIQYCQKKAKEYLNINNQQLLNDSQSYSLLWDYLSLLVRQNGEIDLKTDLSSLLLNDNETWSTSTTPLVVSKDDDYRSNTPNSEINSLTDNLNNRLKLNDDEILTKLRQLLSIGQRLDAIEWSIKHNLWSHAFFIATTTQNLDVKLIDKIKLKFINSFLIQDPLKTCYQLYIGRSPTIPINLIEWNDWRRHLAIILSNKDSFNKDIVLKSIKSIADSLSTNNRVAASHFCYLLSNVQFGEYKKKSSKIVLIGSSHE